MTTSLQRTKLKLPSSSNKGQTRRCTVPVDGFVGGPTNRERVVLIILELVCISGGLVTRLQDLTSLWGSEKS